MLASLAIRCHNIDAMRAFYAEAFGAEFEEQVIAGMTCHFSRTAEMTIKLVPGREATDFQGYPLHQPGIRVADVEAVIEIAKRHGGVQEGEIVKGETGTHGCVRDPDGNTIELYA